VNSTNPYKPPGAPVAHPEKKRSLGAGDYTLAVLIVLQIAFTLFNIGTILQLTRVGALAPYHLLATALCIVLLAVGGVLVLMRARGAVYVFGVAALFGLLALTQLQALHTTTEAALALVACVYIAWRG
jgi:hypothetical protein